MAGNLADGSTMKRALQGGFYARDPRGLRREYRVHPPPTDYSIGVRLLAAEPRLSARRGTGPSAPVAHGRAAPPDWAYFD